MKYTPLPSNLFIKNRNKFINKLENNSIAVLVAADNMPRNGDLFYPFRQNSDFFYLTGIEQEKSRLLTVRKNDEYKTILFIIEPNEKMEVWEGKKLTKDEAEQISGIVQVEYLSKFESCLGEEMTDIQNFYYNVNENPRFTSPVKTSDILLKQEWETTFTNLIFKNLSPIFTQLRLIKEQEEVAIIGKACSITKKAFERVLKTTKPGLKEYEVEAEITYEFSKSGATHAYEPIVAAGINSCFLHYTKNDKILKDGEILFLDFGAEYANYASDCSRAIPVNGTFSPIQKEVYSAVLRVIRKAIPLIVPGASISQYHKAVCKYIEQECVNLGLFTQSDVDNQDPEKPLFKQYYMHGTSHYIGLDTHDLGSKDELLQPGMIVSCEPGIYIPQEGFGIRLENDILITQFGNIDMMGDIPIEMVDIEQLMKAR